MSTPSLDSLQTQLSLPDECLAQLTSLPEPTRTEFVDLVTKAVARKDTRVDAAIDNAVSVVPGPLRRAVKKLLHS